MKQHNVNPVFLDLKLPDMEGAEVFREIKKIKPGLMVTIITGYPGSEMMEKEDRSFPRSGQRDLLQALQARNVDGRLLLSGAITCSIAVGEGASG